MAQSFSVKPPRSWFWRTGWDRQRIVDQLARGVINDSWLVCPHGEAHRSLRVREFLRQNVESPPATPVHAPHVPWKAVAGVLACTNFAGPLVCSGLIAQLAGGENAIALFLGWCAAQAAGVASWGAFHFDTLKRRLAQTSLAGLMLFSGLALPIILVDPPAAFALLLLCPAMYFSIQVPLLGLRACGVGVVVSPESTWVPQVFRVRDLLMLTAVAAATLALARVGVELLALGFGTPSTSDVMLWLALACSGLAGVSALTITPLIVLGLSPTSARRRRVAVSLALTALAIGFGMARGFPSFPSTLLLVLGSYTLAFLCFLRGAARWGVRWHRGPINSVWISNRQPV